MQLRLVPKKAFNFSRDPIYQKELFHLGGVKTMAQVGGKLLFWQLILNFAQF